MGLLAVGTKAPEFTTIDQDGKKRSLSDFHGKKLILYFYPKDNTSGCTKEACAFRDQFDRFRQLNVEVVGVSIDSEKSHKSFAQKYALPFTLLADADKSLVQAYGVWGEKSMYGKTYMGIIRSHFVIDETGKIADVQYKVSPADSIQKAVQALV